jgi:hypothetical protein
LFEAAALCQNAYAPAKYGCFQLLVYYQEFLPDNSKKQAASFTLKDAGKAERVTIQKIDEVNCNPLRI